MTHARRTLGSSLAAIVALAGLTALGGAGLSACGADTPAVSTEDAGATDDEDAGEPGIFCPPSGVSKGPWSLAMTRTSMKVRWEACRPGTDGRIYVRPEAGGAEREAPSTEKEYVLTERHVSLNVDSPPDEPGTFYMHDAALGDLTPGTCYRYELGADRALGGRFCTSRPDGGRVHWLTIGDTNALLGNATRNVLSHHVPLGADFVLHGGDIQYYESVLETWAGWFPAMRPLLSLGAIQPALGNHERETPDELEGYSLRFFGDEAFGGRDMWYRFETGGVHFFVLDSDQPLAPSTTQGAWLTAALADGARQPGHRASIVVMHRAFMTCSDGNGLADERTAYASIFAQSKVALVIQAHIHGYERFEADGITYVTSGGGGGRLSEIDANASRAECTMRKAAGAFFHAVDFVVDGTELTGRAIDDKGAVRDTFTVTLP
ncbi:MAG: metallophosphoesterase family protein [Labilithrix sp.]|nr:metallophosphoesterase family protein [Labilithrix sp.]